jgi:hypothetical protein
MALLGRSRRVSRCNDFTAVSARVPSSPSRLSERSKLLAPTAGHQPEVPDCSRDRGETENATNDR